MHRLHPLIVCCVLSMAAARAGAATVDDITGNWVARPVVEGRQGEFVLGIHADEQGQLRAAMRLPPIEAWNVPLGKAKLEGDTLLTGLGPFTYDADTRTLSGVLPSALVPVREVAVTMSRVDRPGQTARRDEYGVEAEPLWSVRTGAPVFGSPATADGVVYVGSDDGSLYALDAESGETRWRFETGDRVRARPTIHGNRIIVPSDDGFLYSLERHSGTQAWRSRVGASPAPRSDPSSQEFRYDQFSSAAVVSGDTIFVGTLDGALVALDSGEGTRKWSIGAGGAVTSTPVVRDGKVVFGSFDGHVYAIDPEDGSEIWRVDTAAPVVSSPALSDGIVVIGSRSYDLLGIALADGAVRWRFYYWFSWVESSATVHDGTAYVGSSDAGKVYAVSVRDGKERWSFDTLGSAWATPAVTGDRVFIGSVGVRGYITDHRPGFFAIDRVSGKPAWWFRVDHPEGEQLSGFISSPASDGERVFVGGLDGNVYAFDAGR
jgi:outer membrane protein assembly factor BamB